MGLILTATAGLCIWIVLWATDIFGGFDSILIGIVMVLIAILAFATCSRTCLAGGAEISSRSVAACWYAAEQSAHVR